MGNTSQTSRTPFFVGAVRYPSSIPVGYYPMVQGSDVLSVLGKGKAPQRILACFTYHWVPRNVVLKYEQSIAKISCFFLTMANEVALCGEHKTKVIPECL